MSSNSTAASLVNSAAQPGVSPTLRLDFLDGMRGCAALYVVLLHIYVKEATGRTHLWTQWTTYGHYAVAVFIVLSGYCLMMPVARSVDGRLRGRLWGFVRRRSRRILPPYFAALLISIPLDTFRTTNKFAFKFSPQVVSHLLLVHNLKAEWATTINTPMWSVALEWQIYFVFALLLLPLWRKVGILPVVVFAFVIGYAPHLMLPLGANYDWTCPWYVGLFALGMAGALINFSPQMRRLRTLLYHLPLGVLALALSVAVVMAFTKNPSLRENIGLMDPVIGFLTLLIIVHGTRFCQQEGARWSPLVSFLRCKPALSIGSFSYSLYVIHAPIHFGMRWLLLRYTHSPGQVALLQYSVILPTMLVVAYLFHLVFEKPFLSSHTPVRAIERLPERRAFLPEPKPVLVGALELHSATGIRVSEAG